MVEALRTNEIHLAYICPGVFEERPKYKAGNFFVFTLFNRTAVTLLPSFSYSLAIEVQYLIRNSTKF
jgi:hypothetical protein